MGRRIGLTTMVALLSPYIALLATAGTPQGQGPARLPGQVPKEGSVENSYGGTVTEVTKDSITIQWPSTSQEKTKTFKMSDTLAAGKVPKERRLPPGPIRATPMMPEYMYRVTDVKVGDCVSIFYARVNGVDICDHIRIWRRPDGEVPPLPKEAEDLRDWRIAWKAKFPGRQLPPEIANRHYVPYHDWQNAYWARQAPMPREVKQPGPKISQ